MKQPRDSWKSEAGGSRFKISDSKSISFVVSEGVNGPDGDGGTGFPTRSRLDVNIKPPTRVSSRNEVARDYSIFLLSAPFTSSSTPSHRSSLLRYNHTEGPMELQELIDKLICGLDVAVMLHPDWPWPQ